MKNETLDFISGNRNVTLDEFVLGREKSGKRELIFVSLPNSDSPLFALWNSPKTRRKYIINKDIERQDVEIKPAVPKGTGGKKAYAMLMVEEISKIDASLEAKGAILSLISCLEWNTGRIYRPRDKKSMTLTMLSDYLNIGKVKAKSIIKELTAAKIIRYDRITRAYYMSRKFIKKGMTVNET